MKEMGRHKNEIGRGAFFMHREGGGRGGNGLFIYTYDGSSLLKQKGIYLIAQKEERREMKV